MDEHLSKAVKITQAILPSAGAPGVSEILGAVIDMSGFDGVLMVVAFGAIVTGAATSIKAQGGAASDGSDATDLKGSAQTVADNKDNTTFFIDIIRPADRYVLLAVERATQNATVAAAYYIQYGARERPTTQPTGISGEAFVDEIEGTA